MKNTAFAIALSAAGLFTAPALTYAANGDNGACSNWSRPRQGGRLLPLSQT